MGSGNVWSLATTIFWCPCQGSVLFGLGIIDDLQPKSVETGRKDVEKSLRKFRSLPEASDCEQDRESNWPQEVLVDPLEVFRLFNKGDNTGGGTETLRVFVR